MIGTALTAKALALTATQSQTIMDLMQLDMAAVYDQGGKLGSRQTDLASSGVEAQHGGVQGIVWTPSMRRMYTLLDRYSPFPLLCGRCHMPLPKCTLAWKISLLLENPLSDVPFLTRACASNACRDQISR